MGAVPRHCQKHPAGKPLIARESEGDAGASSTTGMVGVVLGIGAQSGPAGSLLKGAAREKDPKWAVRGPW